jgi:iron complex outermembrane receptor protein
VGEKLALRFATFSENHEPFYTNAGPIHTLKATESADSLAYRASAKWVPTSQLTVNVSHDFTQERGTGYSGTNFAPALKAGILPQEIKNPRAVIYRGPQADQNMRQYGFKGDATYDLGSVQLQYLGGYRDLNYRQTTGGNAGIAYPGMPAPTNLDEWSTSYWHTTSKSQVHELRAFASDAARFRWTAGAFLFNEHQTGFLGSVQDQSNAFGGTEFNMPYVRGQSEAGYLDATFDIKPIWRVLGGFRFTHETKSRYGGIGNIYGFTYNNPGNFRSGTEGFRFTENRSSYNNNINETDILGQFLSGTVPGARDNVNRATAGSQPWGRSVPQNASYANSFPDFRVGTDYDIKPGHLAYFTFSTGHASGGFNDNFKPPAGADGMSAVLPARTYRPEQLLSFEVGSKNEFLDHRLRANVSVFDYEYKDMVLQNVIAVPIPNAMMDQQAAFAVRDNIGRARIIGAEFDGAYHFPHGFTVSLAGTFLHARAVDGEIFDGRVAFDPTGGASDKVKINGKVLPRSPTITLNYSVAQNIKTSIGWFDWIVSAQTRSKYYMTIFNGEGFDSQGAVNPVLSDVVPSYTRIDIGAGYSRADGKSRVDVFCSNLTDVAYMSSIINTPDLNLRFFNPPRQMGVRLSLFW